MVLQGSCTTDATISIPDGFTLDGDHFTITAVDPPAGGHFRGAVVRSAGREASVRDLRIATANLSDTCDAGEDRLRGISLVGASGTIAGNVILSLNQAGARSGCQEGIGIQVENAGPRGTEVHIRDNRVSAYQKGGIRVSGDVRANIQENVVTGFGPVDFIAQNGIEIAFGPDAVVSDNLVSGNSYTGPQAVTSTGVLVVGGPLAPGCDPLTCPLTIGARIVRNVLPENDVGVLLENVANALGEPAQQPTRVTVSANVIAKRSLTNGTGTQVGVLDIGNRDRITDNVIFGAGYNPAANPGAFTVRIFAEAPFAIDPIVRRNRIFP